MTPAQKNNGYTTTLFAFVFSLLCLGTRAASSETIPRNTPRGEWIYSEQARIDVTVDPDKLNDDNDYHNLQEPYRPQSQQFFPLPSVWVPASEWKSVTAEGLFPKELEPDLRRDHDGQTWYRLFITPAIARPLQKSAPKVSRGGGTLGHPNVVGPIAFGHS